MMADENPFAGLGLKLPSAAPPTVETPAPGSPFSKLGLSLPNETTASEPADGYYVPWLGKKVATQKEYDAALSAHLNATPTVPETFRDRAIAGKKELVEKVGKKLSENFSSGADQFLRGVGEVTSNQPWSGVTDMAVGGFNATLGNAFGTGFDVAKDTINNLTGGGASNRDVPRNLAGTPLSDQPVNTASLGDRATLFLPGPAGVRIAAKALPEVNALNKVVEHIAEGGEKGVTNALKTLREHPTMTAMDVSPAVETTAIGIAKGGASKGQTQLFDVAKQRTADAPTLVSRAYDNGMGVVPNTEDMIAAWGANARKIGEKQIQPALEKTGPVNITNVINHIDEQIGAQTLNALRKGDRAPLPLSPTQERLLQLRQSLTYHGKDEIVPKRAEYFIDATGAPNAAALDAGAHAIQSRLRVEAESLSKSASGAERLQGGALGEVRDKLVDAIDRAGGGTSSKSGPYKEALAAYRDEKNVQGAFDYVQQQLFNTAKTGEKGLANRPEAFEKWVNGLTDHELASARLSGRVLVDNYMGVSRHAAREGTSIPQAPFSNSKIRMLYGEKEGDAIIAEMNNARRKAEVNANLTKQSITARALAAQEQVAPRSTGTVVENAKNVSSALAIPIMGDIMGGGGVLTSGLLTAGAIQKGYKLGGRAHDIAVNNKYAEIASSTEPQMRNALIQALEAKRMELSGGKKPMNALAASIGYLPRP